MTFLIPADVREKITKMVENQNTLNCTAYSETWLEKGTTREWNYDVAASQEVAEFINSYWLPWWSKADQDMANCRIELVDALHFMMSQALIEFQGDIQSATSWIGASLRDASAADVQGELDTLELARALQLALNDDGNPDVFYYFFNLCYSVGFDLDKIYALYMGKSALNKFRQDHGYKQGTYKKKWDGVREDNHFLSEWVDAQVNAVTVEQIRNFLDTEYAKYQ